MKPFCACLLSLFLLLFLLSFPVIAEEALTLEHARTFGLEHSTYRQAQAVAPALADKAPKARLAEFEAHIRPLLDAACVQCHGPDKQKARFRVDTLDPDLITGADVSWWLEVVDVLSNGDMPPADADEVHLAGADRGRIIDWLSQEIQLASQVRRSEHGHSSFRRLTRYEYNYALQDLLGLSFDFAADLPPEAASEDGFKNSSEMLQISTTQFELYRELGRKALEKATVRGEQPANAFYAIDIGVTGAALEKALLDPALVDSKKRPKQGSSNSVHYLNRESGVVISGPSSSYRSTALVPESEAPPAPKASPFVLVVPGGQRVSWPLGAFLPDRGMLRIRVNASRSAGAGEQVPSLRVRFGYQPSNNSHVTLRLDQPDLDLDAPSGQVETYEWNIPLGEIDRNPYRGKTQPKVNSSESFVLENLHPSRSAKIHIHSIEVVTPAYDSWPPASHQCVFPEGAVLKHAAARKQVLAGFMQRAWRRPVDDGEVARKLALFDAVRPACEDDQEAMIEVLSTVLASPHFLYIAPAPDSASLALASRLGIFLWSSLPDAALLQLAAENKLEDPAVLKSEVDRMLADPRADRFARHFVRQWLGLELLDYLTVEREVHRSFDHDLRAAMAGEPVAFFQEVLAHNLSIMNFLHADFTMVNRPLAELYGLPSDAQGEGFQRVSLDGIRRGGLLTQAGLLAMNSDGKDSHPLKRGIWLLENILNDPPPPPPPSVPEIDLADPEIAKLSLKERMEDHRNDPACMSCHQRIDPWGIAFENFDAVGRWRDSINKEEVDATSTLFNQQELAGIEGLKRYLLSSRQDQFARALVHKLAAYALGRPLSFADRSELERVTGELRRADDGLATLITLLVSSDLFLDQPATPD